jgi:hypothetical protein
MDCYLPESAGVDVKYMDEENDWMYSFVLQYDRGRHRLSGNQVKDLSYLKLIPMPPSWTYPARNMTGQDIRVPEKLANTEVKLFSIRANPEVFYIKFYASGWPAQLPRHPNQAAPRDFSLSTIKVLRHGSSLSSTRGALFLKKDSGG